MFHMIRYNTAGEAPQVVIKTEGGMRIRYHFMLLSPNRQGKITGEWRGNNWDTETDQFDIPVKTNNKGELQFAPLSWEFKVLPNPGVPGERFKIRLAISQGKNNIFSREYEQSDVSAPQIITEDGVFVPTPK